MKNGHWINPVPISFNSNQDRNGLQLTHVRRLFGGSSSQCSPKAISTWETRHLIRSPTVGNKILISRVDRIGDEFRRTIRHQDVSPALVTAGSGPYCPVSFPTRDVYRIRWRNRRESRVLGASVRPTSSSTVVGIAVNVGRWKPESRTQRIDEGRSSPTRRRPLCTCIVPIKYRRCGFKILCTD